MAPTRRPTNGRSPLVNQQQQITSFFSKRTTSSLSSPQPSPSPPSVVSKIKSKIPNIDSSPSPVTPSPLQSKRKKPLLVIGPSPTQKNLYGDEVVGRRVRVYWPLDDSWYEGTVKSYNKDTGKHLVQYDDAEEEMLDLAQEKIQWVEGTVKKFRRLRRLSLVEDDEEEEAESGENDDSEDEDWGTANAEKEEVGDEMELEDEELVDEKANGKCPKGLKSRMSCKAESRKRKVSGEKSVPASVKRIKGNWIAEKSSIAAGVSVKATDSDGSKISNVCNSLEGEAAERFEMRDAEKFRFLKEDRRDANRRHPGDLNYDPRTLYLPPNFLKGLSDGQRQWWEFKSKHMDKVLFFKMGKFYELFEMDAHVGAKELDLQYMKGEQPHCGFPEKNFSMNVEKLAKKGYRVLVVEQTETPKQLELRRRESGSKDKVVKREICAVVTKGTLTEGEMLLANPDPSYLLAVTESCQISDNKQGDRTLGVCVVDVATSKIILGQFGDDSECNALCCLLSELRPVEIIKPSGLLSCESERVLARHTRNPLVNELIPLSEFWDAEKTVSEVKRIYRHISYQSTSSTNKLVSVVSDSKDKDDSVEFLPDVLAELVSAGQSGCYALSALGGTLFYLKQAFLDETLLKFAKIELLPHSGFGDFTQKPYMVLDAAALENLEIFENNRNGDSSGTLYTQLNHCVTAFGKRLLRSWLARPLYHPDSIKERQKAIAGLKGVNLPTVLEFRKQLSSLPDMERVLARVCAISETSGRNANKVVLYEDAAKKQLKEFISALRGCESMVQACTSLGVILGSTESGLLFHLLTPDRGLPDVYLVINHFKDAFDWIEANDSGRIIPREGVDVEYDASCKKIKEVELDFTKYLKEQQELLGDASIKYVTIGKDAYLLEVPESLCNSVPREYELRSSKKGFFRYWTPVVVKLIKELSQAESEKEIKLKNIFQRLVGRFCEHLEKWRQLVSATAELDALISLSIASDYYEGPNCCPKINGISSPDEAPSLVAKSLGHPVLRSDSLDKGTFVSNDVTIGGCRNASFIVLTGPNMGGKSTFLRQVSLAVILAQVGANVPAERFDLSPVDRIFVRMGAKDHIMSGQSTFLTELLETASTLSSATRSSLVVLDELGRGTSTSDGQAIAESVLEHFVHNVKCRGLFSTHYHRLAIDYEKDPLVSLSHMACQVGKGPTGLEEVIFLYRLSPGACPKSYGVNVARLAGLPESVLLKAAAKSQEFERVYGKCRKSEDKPSAGIWEVELTKLLQDLINLEDNTGLHDSAGNLVLDSLNVLQHKARKLLQQN